MIELFDNPSGLDGFEFVEFSASEKGVLEPVFEATGFARIARHRGHRLELACDIHTDEQLAELRRVAPDMLEEWSRTKKAPRHAALLHEKIAQEFKT